MLSKPASAPGSSRRLPSVPRERPSSRPLPPIPRALACKECMSVITSISLLLPLEAVRTIRVHPDPITDLNRRARFLLNPELSEDSLAKHHCSQTCTFHSTYHLLFLTVAHSRNVTLSAPRVRLMATGAHTMQELACSKCSTYLGWKITKASEESERWKEGHFLMELETLCARVDPNVSPRPRPRRPASSSSDDSTLD